MSRARAIGRRVASFLTDHVNKLSIVALGIVLVCSVATLGVVYAGVQRDADAEQDRRVTACRAQRLADLLDAQVAVVVAIGRGVAIVAKEPDTAAALADDLLPTIDAADHARDRYKAQMRLAARNPDEFLQGCPPGA